MAQRAGQPDPEAAADHAGERHAHLDDERRRHCSDSAAPVAARPPITNAPSPPMITRPSCAGNAVHSAVSISGAARVSVFCQENQVPNAPWYM